MIFPMEWLGSLGGFSLQKYGLNVKTVPFLKTY
jgi:hypothetical protein